MRMPVRGRAGGADLDGGDARDDVGGADGDVEDVGAGVEGLEDVLGADVCVGSRWKQQEEKQAEAAHYRWTPFIQEPKRRPIQEPMEPTTAAQARPMARRRPEAGS